MLYNPFIILNQTLFHHLHLSPAIRTDWNELSGWELIPQINASYTFKQVTLRRSAGKTTRNADFTERFNNYNKAFVTSGNIGNPDVAAERSFSWEFGTDYYLFHDLKIAATFFDKNYSRLIDWVNTAFDSMPRKNNLSPAGNYYLAKNIADAMTSGFETDLQLSKTFTAK